MLREGVFRHPNILAQEAMRAVEELKFLKQKGKESSSASEDKWKAPEEGWAKLNCDTTCDKEQGRVGMGILIRDHRGHVMAARNTTRMGGFEPVVAEALSLLDGLQFIVEMGLQNAMIEGDAQTVLTALNEDQSSRARFGHIVEDMRMILRNVSS